MSWINQRNQFQTRFDTLAQENIQGLIADLNQAYSQYVSSAGISQDPNNNAAYNKIIQLSTKAEQIKSAYIQLNDDIVNTLANDSTNTDLSKILSENGELQKQINKLQEIQNEMKVDVETAKARDELLRSRNTEVSRHKLFILNRPIRQGLIPYLWVLTILFFGIGLIIFKQTIPIPAVTATTGAQAGLFTMIYVFLSDKRVLVSLLASAIIVILFLSLKIAGVFGK
jgi:hypothetical protein